MSSKSGCRLSLIVFGLTVCLTIPACRTCKEREGVADEVSASSDAVQDTIRKLHEIIIPEMTFFPPATIIDAVDFFKPACRVNDKSGTTPEQSGISFTVSLPQVPLAGGDSQPADPFAAGAVTNSMPKIPAVSVRNINLNDAIKIVCEVTGMRMYIRGDGEVVLASKRLSFDEDFVTRSYNVPPRLADCLFSGRAGKASEADPNKVWQAFFEELGVTGPDFARVVCLPTIGKLLVTNTAENLNVIEAVFDQFSLDLVEVDMQIHAFRTQDIERLQLAGGVTVETLTELRRKGRSKPVAASTALTKSGQEAVVKAVQEAVCPTELNVGAEQSGSNVTSRGAANALTPGNFEMRGTGMTLQVVPEIAQNGAIINLMLNPQWVTLEGWESYSAALASGRTHKTLAFRQPVFGVTSFQTQVSLKDGATVLLGSSSTPDGKWVHVGFLTVKRMDVRAGPLGCK